MTLRRQSLAALAALLILSILASTARPAIAGTGDTAGVDPFPEYEAIRGNVGFWVRVFSEWTLAEAAVHDLEHPQLIYEVVALPGPIEERYTEEQTEFLEQVRMGWEDYLEYLEQKLAAGDELTPLDQQWVAHITEAVGQAGFNETFKRVRTQRGLRERFRAGLCRSTRYEPVIREILREEGLPEDLAYLPHVESSFQYHARSSVGATGLWQFTKGTGRQYMRVNSTLDERLDPIAATRGAAAYLSDAYDRLGTWALALTSYNYGVVGMTRAHKRFGSDFNAIYREYDGRTFGFASKNFYAEFLAAREIGSNVESFFPEGFDGEPRFDLDSVTLERRAAAKSIATAYDVKLERLFELNPAWSRKAVERGAALPEGVRVWLPAGTLAELARSGVEIRVPGLDSGEVYVVHSGDTLSEIAGRHGVTVGSLRELNGISSTSSLIRPGQTLLIRPGGAASVHVVRRGDTLSEIAHTYRVSVSELRRVNSIPSRSSVIQVGSELKLPAGSQPSASSRRHVVRRGETLLEIAARYGVRIRDLLQLNTLSLDTVIHPGQSLRLPGPPPPRL